MIDPLVPISTMEDAIRFLVLGIASIGKAVNYFVKYLLSVFGLNVPDIYLNVATICVIVFALWKFQNAIGRIVMITLVFLLISCILGIGMDILGGFGINL